MPTHLDSHFLGMHGVLPHLYLSRTSLIGITIYAPGRIQWTQSGPLTLGLTRGLERLLVV
jgi:hypothetical protein